MTRSSRSSCASTLTRGSSSLTTLQKVRELSGEAYSYRDDYQIIGQLKQLADKFRLCLLIVHHTRKSPANDEFDRISGTTGIYGCADGRVCAQQGATDGQHRDAEHFQAATSLTSVSTLCATRQRCNGTLNHADTELYKEPPDLLLEKVATLVTDEHPTWQGSATELISAMGCEIPAQTR